MKFSSLQIKPNLLEALDSLWLHRHDKNPGKISSSYFQ